jgi:hypothetical protein
MRDSLQSGGQLRRMNRKSWQRLPREEKEESWPNQRVVVHNANLMPSTIYQSRRHSMTQRRLTKRWHRRQEEKLLGGQKYKSDEKKVVENPKKMKKAQRWLDKRGWKERNRIIHVKIGKEIKTLQHRRLPAPSFS